LLGTAAGVHEELQIKAKLLVKDSSKRSSNNPGRKDKTLFPMYNSDFLERKPFFRSFHEI
jgi:hypothetical protein